MAWPDTWSPFRYRLFLPKSRVTVLFPGCTSSTRNAPSFGVYGFPWTVSGFLSFLRSFRISSRTSSSSIARMSLIRQAWLPAISSGWRSNVKSLKGLRDSMTCGLAATPPLPVFLLLPLEWHFRAVFLLALERRDICTQNEAFIIQAVAFNIIWCNVSWLRYASYITSSSVQHWTWISDKKIIAWASNRKWNMSIIQTASNSIWCNVTCLRYSSYSTSSSVHETTW